MKRWIYWFAGAAAIVLLAGAVYLSQRESTSASSPMGASAPLAVAPPTSAPSAPQAKVHYRIDDELAASSATSFDLQAALSDLLGLKTVQSMFRLDGFPRRLVATIDNLGRSHAPEAIWPVNPVSGRFTVEERDGATFIGTDNGLRYTPYVLLLETVDLRQVVALYARIYPELQRAYEEIGYPKDYFNDRLVQVIDQLLATPEVDVPLQVRLPTIEGPLRPARPWVLYEFVDPELRSLTSGQKMLLRAGSVNERRIKLRLSEVRRLVTAGRPKR